MPLVREILEAIEYVGFNGNEEATCEKVIPLDAANASARSLMWCSAKNANRLKQVRAGTIIVEQGVDRSLLDENCNYIFTTSPRRTFTEVLERFFAPAEPVGVHPTASVHETVKYGQRLYIGRNVVIEKDCVVGDDVRVDHNTVVKRGTIIGNRVHVGSNCTIGGSGFGFEKDREGRYVPIPHLGNVVLGDDVSIGENSCVDRAVMGSTVLEENVKVDNLVHIAHGVRIGTNSIITANTMVAGSATVGSDSWLAPSTSIMNGIEVGPKTFTGLGAVVIGSLEGGDVVVGNPAKRLRKNEI